MFNTAPQSGGYYNQSYSRYAILGRNYAPFNNPFFDVASTYLPSTMKSMFGFCRFYYLTHGIINAVTSRYAQYPITDVVLKSADADARKRWEGLLLETMDYRTLQLNVNLDYFCLAAGTPVITDKGTFPIEELKGQTVQVLSEGGVWRSATFDSYGVQKLYEVELAHGEKLLATAEHEWPVIDTNQRRQKVTTLELKNKFLIRNAAPRPERDAEYYDGLRHGIVFGDGTLSNEGRQAHVLFYRTGKKQELTRFFEESYTVTPHHADEYVGVYGLPPKYKALPDATRSASYWYGFVCGFIATYGGVDVSGQTTLHQMAGKGLQFVAEQLPRFGMVGKPLVSRLATTGFKECQMEKVALKTAFMRPEDFVRQDQRARFEDAYGDDVSTYGLKSKVKAVRELDRVEEVYCCEEPETHTFTIGNGVLTGNCYGNCFVTPHFPFRKVLTCAPCGAEVDAVRSRSRWRYTNGRFYLTCEKCGQTDYAKSRDDAVPDQSKITLVRWNPEQVNIHLNEATGECDYTLEPSRQLRSDIMMGRKDLVATTPEVFLKAVRSNSAIVMDRRRVHHMRRPSLSGHQFAGWGPPLLMPVLKDAFYVQIMKKAQESIMLSHIVPQHFLFPQPATGGADPFTTTNLQDWREKLRSEITRQRMDPAYMAILPFPVGHQTIGGDGRSLMLVPEIRELSEQLVAAMGFPIDLMYGSGNYAGTSVAMRMLENQFISNINDHKRLLKWFMGHVATFLNLPMVDASFKPFRMADDLQRQAFLLQLQQTQNVSATTLLASANLDHDDEMELIESEVDKRQAAMEKMQGLQDKLQGNAMVTGAKMQAKAQMLQNEALQREGSMDEQDPFLAAANSNLGTSARGYSLDATVAALAQKLRTLPPAQQTRYLEQLTARSGPELAQLAQEQAGIAPQGPDLQLIPSQQQAPMEQPMAAPEVLPPRRLEALG